MSSDNLLHITTQNFSQEVSKSDIPVLVDFWAPWCGPCLAATPILEELAQKYKDKIKVGKVNVDEETSLASQFRVMSIPTMILFKDGILVKQMIGLRPASDLEKIINDVI